MIMADQGAVQLQSHYYKVVLLGDPNVGKTSFFLRIRDGNKFCLDYSRLLNGHDWVLDYHMKIEDCDVTVRIRSKLNH